MFLLPMEPRQRVAKNLKEVVPLSTIPQASNSVEKSEFLVLNINNMKMKIPGLALLATNRTGALAIRT
jgi:hypothetical protein